MSWLLTSLTWYFYLLLLGVVFFPLTKKILGRFSIDSGYAFSKIIAIIFLSYSVLLFGFLKVLPFERTSLFLLLAIAFIINAYLYHKDPQKKAVPWFMIFFEEILFLIGFIAWTFVRSQEPSARGLEKFMDFGFINSILRAKYFPPLDIWYSGYPINYYYFGHLSGALLIKLSSIKSSIGYNLILSTLFALGITQVFSFSANIVSIVLKSLNKTQAQINFFLVSFIGLLTAFIVNLGGNLHTIYLFTKGYPNENPVPFWQILSWFNPTKYWYPNATRFIPFTIHEFPIYSYVVADLHGHVFDIPFVLLTLAILFQFFVDKSLPRADHALPLQNTTHYSLLTTTFLGFLTSIHYMTNAFDGPIYILLIMIIFFFVYKLSYQFFLNIAVLIISFFIFALPFSVNFSPFVSGIGMNCSPSFLVDIGKLGPLLFEKDNCQGTPLWMLFILWGFFWISAILLIITRTINSGKTQSILNLGKKQLKKLHEKLEADKLINVIDCFMLILFAFGTLLIIIPVFFYIKDIYPAHFRANTMFKLGYQAFTMMGLASGYTFFRLKFRPLKIISALFFCLIVLYPLFAIPSYYGNLSKTPVLDGSAWLSSTFPSDREIIDYLNKNIKNQPVIIEAQGDSYTDYERISSYTGLPTVAGWQVHEWLWRGSADIVGKRIPDIVNFYESSDLSLTKSIAEKYQIAYVIVSDMERQKYKNISENKFNKLGRLIFKSSTGKGAIYQLNQ